MADKWQQLGDNVSMKVEGDELLLKVDLSRKGEISKSGKSLVVASTRGNLSVDASTMVGLSVYRKV